MNRTEIKHREKKSVKFRGENALPKKSQSYWERGKVKFSVEKVSYRGDTWRREKGKGGRVKVEVRSGCSGCGV